VMRSTPRPNGSNQPDRGAAIDAVTFPAAHNGAGNGIQFELPPGRKVFLHSTAIPGGMLSKMACSFGRSTSARLLSPRRRPRQWKKPVCINRKLDFRRIGIMAFRHAYVRLIAVSIPLSE
jgi:hypothetical protein